MKAGTKNNELDGNTKEPLLDQLLKVSAESDGAEIAKDLLAGMAKAG